MFVIIGSWENIKEKDKQRPVYEKIGLTLKDAGVSITVTSLTDIMAFGIGATTVGASYNICLNFGPYIVWHSPCLFSDNSSTKVFLCVLLFRHICNMVTSGHHLCCLPSHR